VHGEYQTLALTEASGEVLRGQRTVMLRRDAPAPKPPKAAARPRAAGEPRGSGERGGSAPLVAADLSARDAAMFEKLRVWRGTCAKEQGVPAYVVFHDATLRQIAVVAPTTLAGLSDISGVGEAKLAKYGEQLLAVLADAD
jgi:ATP-dependent DNA helicase RecQ